MGSKITAQFYNNTKISPFYWMAARDISKIFFNKDLKGDQPIMSVSVIRLFGVTEKIFFWSTVLKAVSRKNGKNGDKLQARIPAPPPFPRPWMENAINVSIFWTTSPWQNCILINILQIVCDSRPCRGSSSCSELPWMIINYHYFSLIIIIHLQSMSSEKHFVIMTLEGRWHHRHSPGSSSHPPLLLLWDLLLAGRLLLSW